MGPSTIKLLSIDNKAKFSELDRKRYRNMGVLSHVVNSFTEAETELNTNSYDIIVLNFDYEKIDAASIAYHFKQTKEFSSIPIVITTVQDKGKAAKKMKDNSDLLIEFPIPGPAFVEKIRSLLDRQTRQNQRITHKLVASYISKGKKYEASVEDISSTGVLLGIKNPITSGESVEIEFTLPGYKKPFKATGEVVREVDIKKDMPENTKAIGAKFINFHGDSEKRLNSFLAKQEIVDSKLSYYL